MTYGAYGNDEFDSLYRETYHVSLKPDDAFNIRDITSLARRDSVNRQFPILHINTDANKPNNANIILNNPDINTNSSIGMNMNTNTNTRPKNDPDVEKLEIQSGGPKISVGDDFIDKYFDKILIILLLVLVIVLVMTNYNLYKNNELMISILKEIVLKKD
jgi:hypothetical protein